MKKVLKLFKYIINTTERGFYYICSTLSRGFFFYFSSFFSGIEKIVSFAVSFFKKLQRDPAASFLLIFIFGIGVFSYTYIYTGSEADTVNLRVDKETKQVVPTDENNDSSNESKSSMETNLYRRYSSTSIENINFEELKNTNSQVNSWIIVDGTNINYPVVHTDNNDYYLNHNILNKKDSNGWTFMDYRNDGSLNDYNTIFYGHNLLNKTAFGSISNLFTDKWFNKSNHSIVVVTESGMATYQIFAVYYSEPITDYLQTRFDDDEDYLNFLNNLKSKSVYNFGIELNSSDRIITLSTCTDDNKGRKVVHAKRIS